jgi:hypothetical protein
VKIEQRAYELRTVLTQYVLGRRGLEYLCRAITGFAKVFVHHLGPNRHRLLAEILERATVQKRGRGWVPMKANGLGTDEAVWANRRREAEEVKS